MAKQTELSSANESKYSCPMRRWMYLFVFVWKIISRHFYKRFVKLVFFWSVSILVAQPNGLILILIFPYYFDLLSYREKWFWITYGRINNNEK